MCGPEISRSDSSMLFKFCEAARTEFENAADQGLDFRFGYVADQGCDFFCFWDLLLIKNLIFC
jgi:hypothetical protein